jgi:hypothetical protein
MVKTLTFHIADSTERMLHLPLPSDLPEGPLDIVMVIIPSTNKKTVPSMAGRWRAYFSEDFDLDSTLHEIRL